MKPRWIRDIYDLSGIRRQVHRVRNRGNRPVVFIWIPKNAGTSVYSVLAPYGLSVSNVADQIKYRFSGTGFITFAHLDYAMLVEKGVVSRAFDQAAFKFCFSRCPYDRAASLYYYLRTHPYKKLADSSFKEFLRTLSEEGIRPIGLKSAAGLSFCNPQKRWVERVEIDFTGRVENMDTDLPEVCRRIGVPPQQPPITNRSGRARMDGAPLFDSETKALVENIYAEDFKHFAYPILPLAEIERHSERF